MKKFIASALFIVAFSTYALYLHAVTPTAASTDTQTATVATTQTAQQAATNSTTNSNTSRTVATIATTPVDQPKGQYKDGTYTGASANAFYGDVQVKVTVLGGKITDVAFLNYPNDRRQSQEINSYAMPILKQQAIAAQSAQVDGVSGASDTSEAFMQSLSSALSSARA